MPRRPIRATVHAADEPPDATDGVRDAFARWASGVTVVAARDEPHIYAITATAFAPVSLAPPLVLVCVGPNATVWPFLTPDAPFGISLLAAGQRRVASIVGDGGPLLRPLFPPAGDPLVDGALVGLACTVRETHAGGDHCIVVGEVQRITLGPDAPPLAYFERQYRSLA